MTEKQPSPALITMTTDEINIAIATACGHDLHWKKALNYAASLDAMHGATASLSVVERRVWVETLQILCVEKGDTLGDLFMIANATALQRTEAFLRVKGLWKQ